MRNYFEDLDAIHLTSEMDNQLRAQVDVAWPKEVLCLEEHGLKNARNILDIGTGNAYFLLRLAKRYPEKMFTGIEVSEPLIRVAEELIKENQLPNVRLVKDRCPTDRVNADFDLITARLSLYLMPNREDVISWSYGLLSKGSRMIITDLMDFGVHTFPERKGWYKLFRAYAKRCGEQGADRNIGRILPHILLKNGFKNIKLDIKQWYSSIEMESETFYSFFKSIAETNHKAMPEYFSKEDLAEFISVLDEIKRDPTLVAINPITVVSGMK
ncbi:MAG: methyltransferase domain-containing protein [Deltaproteobacteria bacterium]|nr:methyltransferase domain-containing protein [Deltaproteobacteria bacterium]